MAIFIARADGMIGIGDVLRRCALGPGGVVAAADKREGDGASPAGVWPIRQVIYRPDRGPAPITALPTRAMTPDDGWCDDPADPGYNRAVVLPYPASAERMWREDHVYDLVLVLGHNDDPPVAGLGSAIFLHIAQPDYAPTQGCVAVAQEDLEDFLRLAQPGDAVEIRV